MRILPPASALAMVFGSTMMFIGILQSLELRRDVRRRELLRAAHGPRKQSPVMLAYAGIHGPTSKWILIAIRMTGLKQTGALYVQVTVYEGDRELGRLDVQALRAAPRQPAEHELPGPQVVGRRGIGERPLVG